MADTPLAPPPLPPEKRNSQPLFTSSSETKEDSINKNLYDLNLFDKKSITKIEHVPQTGPKLVKMICYIT